MARSRATASAVVPSLDGTTVTPSPPVEMSRRASRAATSTAARTASRPCWWAAAFTRTVGVTSPPSPGSHTSRPRGNRCRPRARAAWAVAVVSTLMPSCARVSVSGTWSRARVSRADAAVWPCSSRPATVTPSPTRSRTTSCSVTNPVANTRRIRAAVAGQTWRRYHPAKRRGGPARRSPGAAEAARGASGAGDMRSSMPTHCTARVRDRRAASCSRRARSAQPLLGVVADDAAHDVEEALGEALGVGVVGALRVHVKDRLVGVGQQLHPPPVAPQLNAVHETDLAVVLEVALQMLGGRAHDRALERPWAGDRLVHERAGGDLRDLLAEGTRLRGQQLEQLAEAHHGVERRQELGEDVAAPEGAGEDHAVLGRRLRQGRQRDLGAVHLCLL